MRAKIFQTPTELRKFMTDRAVPLASTAAVYFDTASGKHVLVAEIGPYGLSYPVTAITFRTGTAITDLYPTNGGSTSTYGINPSLSAGLSFDTATGRIYGTPSATQTVRTHTITASNSYGSNATCQIAITVVAP